MRPVVLPDDLFDMTDRTHRPFKPIDSLSVQLEDDLMGL
jgi:hypothetical protein